MADLGQYMGEAFIVITTAFIILSGLLLPGYLKTVKDRELDRIKSQYGKIANTVSFRSAVSSNEKFTSLNYVVPVLFTAAVVFVASWMAMLSANFPVHQRMVLLGSTMIAEGDEAAYTHYAKLTLVTTSYAFFGVFIWSIQNILTRIMARNITPATFYMIAINIIFALVVSSIVHHTYEGGATYMLGAVAAKDQRAWMASMGFIVGLTPELVMERIRTGMGFGGKKDNQAQPMPLRLLEGVSSITEFRLRELSMSDVQNLARCNPVELYMQTPSTLTVCLDWVGQAQLCLLVTADGFQALRARGIRTILDLRYADPDRTALLLGWDADWVRQALRGLERDPSYVRLASLSELMVEATLAAVPGPSQEEPAKIGGLIPAFA